MVEILDYLPQIDIMFTNVYPLYKLSGTFDREELQEFNLNARKPFRVLAEDE